MRASSGSIVVVPGDVIKTIESYSIDDEKEVEAGGIFIGAYRAKHIEVVSCTVPMATDIRGRYSYDRKDLGHQLAATAAWKDSGHTLTYVGEWHTHPESFPTPSFQDKWTWRRVMKRRSSLPFLFLIQGWRDRWCAIGQGGKIQELIVT